MDSVNIAVHCEYILTPTVVTITAPQSQTHLPTQKGLYLGAVGVPTNAEFIKV